MKKPVTWPRITIEVASEVAEIIEEALLEAGSLGTVTEDDETRAVPGLAYQNTGITKLVAAFEESPETQQLVEKTIDRYLKTMNIEPSLSMHWDILAEEDWDAKFKAAWKSLDLGCGVFIVPSWERDKFVAPADVKAVIYLDPGMAFGTGHHETTTLCAQALVEAVSQKNALKVLDVGTGTAILAILAAILGAEQVVGTDICEDALVVAQENIEINKVSHQIAVYNKNPDEFGAIFDVVVANIMAHPLIDLAPQITAALKTPATLILSGILAPQADAVRRAYESLGLQHQHTVQQGEWVAISFLRA